MIIKSDFDWDKIVESISGMSISYALSESMEKDIKINFYFGVDEIEKLVNRNIVDINPEVLDYLRTQNFTLIKGMNQDLANKLKGLLQRNISEGKSVAMIEKEIKDLFNSTIERARIIARTETARAYNVGQQLAAEKANVKLLKYYRIVEDDRTSPLCLRLGHKYNKENAIPINQRFKDNVTGESWLVPPTHPNCRSSVGYILE